jgi:hypothetical protein
MHVDSANTNNIYIATNSTNVLHATCIGNKTNPLTYKPAEISELQIKLRSLNILCDNIKFINCIKYCR